MKDDLISRQAAIDIVNRYNQSHMILKGKPIVGAASMVIEMEGLPSAERPTGKWVDAVIPNDNGDLLVQVCDQCSTFFPLEYTGGGHHFCPNCGARMKGGEDSEND